jgi:ABC-2 type transport system ATP-binding protein
VEIRELMRELARMGKTIFFSTHILADVAEICTRVGILEAGKLVAVGELDALRQQIMPARPVEIVLLSAAAPALALLSAYPGVSQVEQMAENGAGVNGRARLRCEFSGDDAALTGLLAHLVSAGVSVLNFSADQRDLEEVFLRATRGQVT